MSKKYHYRNYFANDIEITIPAVTNQTIEIDNSEPQTDIKSKNDIIVEDENVTHLNRIPKAFYVKVAYKETVNKRILETLESPLSYERSGMESRGFAVKGSEIIPENCF